MSFSIGERISYCRNLLGISRAMLCSELPDLSVPTLTRWELNMVKIPPKRIELLVDYFIKQNILVTKDWLLFGKGEPPTNLNLKEIQEFNFDDLANQTFLNLRGKISNFSYYQVNNNFFAPFVTSGDYIGGVTAKKYENIISKMCFLKGDTLFYVGIASSLSDDTIDILNFNNQTIKIDTNIINEFGEIQWMVKRA